MLIKTCSVLGSCWLGSGKGLQRLLKTSIATAPNGGDTHSRNLHQKLVHETYTE